MLRVVNFPRSQLMVVAILMWGACVSLPARGGENYDYNPDNGAAMSLFRLGGTARGQAMGGAYASLAGGSEAVYWNPGGLGYQESRFQLVFSPRVFRKEEYELGQDERTYFMGHAGVHVRSWTVAVAFLHHNIGDILFNDGGADDAYGENDVSLDRTFSNGQWGFILGAGGTFLTEHLGVGAGIRFLNHGFSGALIEGYAGDDVETSGTGFAIQLGGTYRPNADLSVALVYDLPSQVDWGRAEKDKSAQRLQTAASYRLLRGPTNVLTVALQFENIGGAWARAHVGGEMVTFRRVALRAGFKNLHLKSSGIGTGDLNEATSFTVGVGTYDLVLMGKLPVALDVSFDSVDFNSQFVATLSVGF